MSKKARKAEIQHIKDGHKFKNTKVRFKEISMIFSLAPLTLPTQALIEGRFIQESQRSSMRKTEHEIETRWFDALMCTICHKLKIGNPIDEVATDGNKGEGL